MAQGGGTAMGMSQDLLQAQVVEGEEDGHGHGVVSADSGANGEGGGQGGMPLESLQVGREVKVDSKEQDGRVEEPGGKLP